MSDELSLKKLRGKVIEREYLDTDAIQGADGIRDIFAQLANERVRFQGIEWDFLSLEVEEEVERAFVARFGPKPAVREDYAGSLMRRVDRVNYGVVDASVLRACPESYRGEGWERWLLSIDGGNVVVVTTVFQVSIIALKSFSCLWADSWAFAGIVGCCTIYVFAGAYQYFG